MTGHYDHSDSSAPTPGQSSAHEGRDKWDFHCGGVGGGALSLWPLTGHAVPAAHRPRPLPRGEADPTAPHRRVLLFCTKEPSSPNDSGPLFSRHSGVYCGRHTWLLSGLWKPQAPRLLIPSPVPPCGGRPNPLNETVHHTLKTSIRWSTTGLGHTLVTKWAHTGLGSAPRKSGRGPRA